MLSARLFLAIALSIAGPDDRLDAEKAKHQGEWEVTSYVRDGKDASPEIRASIRRVVEGDHVVWKRNGQSFAGTRFEVDPSKSPATIDLIPDGGPQKDKHILGIYRLEGEILTICVADVDQPRPLTFDAEPGSKKTLQKLHRVKR
jgi:uncharacterized protein (TIGR03067 family)